MEQLHLFRPQGTITRPLTEETRHEARDLLAELLLVIVTDNTSYASTQEGTHDGRDPKTTS